MIVIVRRGITLVELTVVIAILGLLLSLAAVAILNSRSSSRVLVCKNHMRNIGIATTAFADARKHFPYSRHGKPRFLGLALLLPGLEQSATLDQMYAAAPGTLTEFPALHIFRCPDDAQDNLYPYVNYLPCGGRTYQADKPNTIGYYKIDSAKEVKDGLSNTVFYSERLTMGYDWPREPEISLRYPTMVREFFMSESEFDAQCIRNAQSLDPSYFGPTPLAITLAQYPFGTKYLPNAPSCVPNGSGLHPPDLQVWEIQSIAVSSLHSKFCQVVLGDASVKSISQDVSAEVWQAMGTVAGGELGLQ